MSSALVNFLLPIVLVRLLPGTSYAAWVLVFGIATYATYLDLGLQVSVATLVARALAGGDHHLVTRYVTGAVRLLAVSAAVILSVFVVIAVELQVLFPRLPATLYPSARFALLALAVAQVGTLFSNIFIGYFNGLQRSFVAAKVIIAGRLLTFVATISVASFGMRLTAVALSYSLASTATTGATAVTYLLERSRSGYSSPKTAPVTREVARITGVVGSLSLCLLLITGLDTTVIGRLDYGGLAPYGIALAVVSLLSGAFGSVLAPLLPEFAKLAQEGRVDRVSAVVTRVSSWVTSASMVGVAAILVTGWPVLSILAGASLGHHAFALLAVLSFAGALRISATPLSAAVIALLPNKPVLVVVGLCEGLSNLTLSIILCSRIGAVGVAIGTVAGALIGAASLALAAMRYNPVLLRDRRTIVTQGWLRPLGRNLPALAGLGALRAPLTWGSYLTVPVSVALVGVSLCLDALWVARTLGARMGKSPPAELLEG